LRRRIAIAGPNLLRQREAEAPGVEGYRLIDVLDEIAYDVIASLPV